jgi:nicotinate-nucleotide pyrophosphorylase (carboxylating)
MTPAPPDASTIEHDVRRALEEDVGRGVVTADMLAAQQQANARVIARERAVICGRPWFDACFRALDPRVQIRWHVVEGAHVPAGATLCDLAGNARALVTAERSALNFLQTLSATATTTAAFVAANGSTRPTILDTRKTLPGLRLAQKYAVRAGGGSNHRMGLHDAVLIKENHIAAAGTIAAAVSAARASHPDLPVEVEVENFAELREALATGVDRILLDDFERDDLMRAVATVAGAVKLEISGNVTLDNVRACAETGVDYISIGALTKNVQALDLSMRIRLAAPADRPALSVAPDQPK